MLYRFDINLTSFSTTMSSIIVTFRKKYIFILQVQNKILYTGSSDWTGKSWVVEFGDCTRTYKGHKHSVSCIKFIDGLCKLMSS